MVWKSVSIWRYLFLWLFLHYVYVWGLIWRCYWDHNVPIVTWFSVSLASDLYDNANNQNSRIKMQMVLATIHTQTEVLIKFCIKNNSRLRYRGHFLWDYIPNWGIKQGAVLFFVLHRQLLVIQTTRRPRSHDPKSTHLAQVSYGNMLEVLWVTTGNQTFVSESACSSLMGPSAANSVALLQIDPSVSPSSSSPRRVKVTLEGKGERDIYLQLLSDIRSHSHGEEVTWSSWEEWLYQGRLEPKNVFFFCRRSHNSKWHQEGKCEGGG